MTQLVINGHAMPESQNGGYRAWEEDLSVEAVMISGRMVKEISGTVWRVSYQYGFFNDEQREQVIADCRKGRREPIVCSILPPEGGDMIVSSFWVTSFTEPKFMWSSDGKPMWADFSFELREVNPHD